MRLFEEIKKGLGEITEITLLLIALGVVVEILFGQAVPPSGGIVTNLTGLLNTLGENGLAGLAAAGVILFLFYRKRHVVAVADTALPAAGRSAAIQEPRSAPIQRKAAQNQTVSQRRMQFGATRPTAAFPPED
jgi:hypothetical protein